MTNKWILSCTGMGRWQVEQQGFFLSKYWTLQELDRKGKPKGNKYFVHAIHTLRGHKRGKGKTILPDSIHGIKEFGKARVAYCKDRKHKNCGRIEEVEFDVYTPTHEERERAAKGDFSLGRKL